MPKQRLNQFALLSADHKVIDLFEFEYDAETVLKEHQANGDYEGAYASNVMVTVEKIEDMKRTAIGVIERIIEDYDIDSDSPVHLMTKKKGLITALELLALGGPSDD